MTAQFTQTNNLLPSNLAADVAASVKTKTVDGNFDNDMFSSVLDKASKNYVDKSEVKSSSKTKNDSKALKTKDVKSAQADTTESSDAKKVVFKNVEENKTEKTNVSKGQNAENVVKEDTSAVKQNVSCAEKDSADIEELQPVEEEKEEIVVFDETKTVDELLEQIRNNVCVVPQDTVVDEIVDDESSVLSLSANKIVNEKLLSNIDCGAQSEVDYKQLSVDLPKESVVSAVNKGIQQEVDLSPSDNLKDVQNVVDDSVENADVELKVVSDLPKETKDTAKTESSKDVVIKSAKENLAADNSRLTVNLEQDVEQESMIFAAEPVTPLDTKVVQEDDALKIRVTDEVASQVRDNNVTGIENKDTTSKAKDKAVETMTALKDKDTTVVEVKTSNSENNTESSLNQNNANETAARLNVQNSNVASVPVDNAESFVAKMDSQLSANQSAPKETVQLNQADILNQMSAKFEQMQQQSTNKVSIDLQPESLGKVSVEIMNTKEGIVAKMTAESHQVKELFEKSLDSLKNSLAAQGVNVNSIKVESAQESSNNAMNFERNQFEQAFNNQQNGHNQANKSNQEQTASYSAASAGDSEEQDESMVTANTETAEEVTKYNGKVDYLV